MTVCNSTVRRASLPALAETASEGIGAIEEQARGGPRRASHAATVRRLSDRLVQAQRPLRILDAVQWGDEVERGFFARGARELPCVTQSSYLARPLSFDPNHKRQELLALDRDVRRCLGKQDAAGKILLRTCAEYRAAIALLEARGTPAFGALSRELYGSATDRLLGSGPTLAGMARQVACLLGPASPPCPAELPTLSAADTVGALAGRLADYFGGPHAVRVRLSDGIVADAAAGSDYIKIRSDARFTVREVRLLEVHEGWAHLGTTLNGQAQPVCTFLSKGPPSATPTQEGLAVLTELLAFASCPSRLRRLLNRVEGVARAEAGATFLDVFQFFREQGLGERESYQHTMRIFRGSLPEGAGPFTKDLCYVKGLVLVGNYLRLALSRGQTSLIPLLFCGKTNLADMKALAHLVEEGLILPPRYLPPPFADLQGLSAWLGCGGLFGALCSRRVEGALSKLV